jgi:phosphoribosylformylglycinamidine (FGAM) synthase-like enzyme
MLPESDRLRRALALPLEEIEYIVDNFKTIMNRQPTSDERKCWKAVFDFKRSQS